ncbi:DUF6916 family protein [Dyadobacter sp. CY326]|uniref:DUF6916 family protein n=1 Tax=Dyadobacter sp. CY326 TaxID=2907300 RepID=UPI001F42DC41|nr:hypothetical protein [Dyadobacter sp. CY326]MCE7065179.1 hypothetical protein [Dyadobacter sp. CY326]
METYDLSRVTAQDFKDYLGQKLHIEFLSGEPVPVTVKRVTDLETYSPLERGAFSVVLQTDGDSSHRPQGIYRILYPQSHSLEVFLVPIGTDQSGTRYEAVFS